MSSKHIGIILGIVCLVLIGFWYNGQRQTPTYATFAQCLRDQGVTMYGAAWCPHCQNQKRAFGDSFKYIPYVECPDEPAKCQAAGVTGYPTWIFTDGSRLEGEQALSTLGEKTSCPFKADGAQ
jgi:glutaredoxin